ncbi:uncharacterized protein VP01_1903g2 [Puccinia sorghi]|uniref:Uncharacterized protein n=1 Tax=Puccinia sorghi TaxID=27349 RepID=A0A0L6VCX4_9BASI|nr:uncharacterized protein VP01_1903g2 [Puccinia sorghi]
MRMMGKERAQQFSTEETLQQTQALLDTTAGQRNPAPAPARNTMVLSKSQPFDGTCGAADKVFVGQIGLHAVTYPEHFPTDARKAMDLCAFQKTPRNRLSDAEQSRRFQQNLCFRCSQAGNLSCECLNGGQKPQDRLKTPSSTWILLRPVLGEEDVSGVLVNGCSCLSM